MKKSSLERTPYMASESSIVIAHRHGLALLSDNRTHRNRMEVRSASSSRKYIVAQNNRGGVDHGRWECSCMGWIRWRKCKHLKAMTPALHELDAAVKAIG